MLFNSTLLTAIVVVIAVPAILVGYVGLMEWGVGRLPFGWQPKVRPWLWLAPGLILLGIFLLYPALDTIYLSFFNSGGTSFVGLSNYNYFFSDPGTLVSLRNNLYWLIFLTVFTTALGLVFAVLFDRVRYESTAKAVLFMPLAISFTAASIIWKLMYDYQPPGATQTGTLDKILTLLGAQPAAWTVQQNINNPSLIWVGIWMWTGFTLVILSAAYKGIPAEVLEAARVDGANEWQIFRQVITPMMSTTIIVVGTTMVINSLKIFDIIYVMTGGNFNTTVMAVRMYIEMFNFLQFGRAAAVATVLLVTIIPFMVINIRRFRAQEAMR